jgi:tellurite methyltransferase
VSLFEYTFLDPRPAEDAAHCPIGGAVNIPFGELPRRTHELPPRDDLIQVAGPVELASEVVAWLERGGRRAAVARVFEYSPKLSKACGAPQSAQLIGRLWKPNAFLAEVLPELPAGAALDLACGTGRDAVYLAADGWDVTGVDVLPDALERARDLASRYVGGARPISFMQIDLEADSLGVEELTGGGSDRRFELITMFRYLHRPLLARLGDWLRPGGSILIETFTTIHRERHGQPAKAAHVLEPGELPELLPGLGIRHFSEAWRGEAHTARLWAVR